MQDVPDEDIEKCLSTKKMDGPRIVAFDQDGETVGLYVVGDGVYSEVKKGGLLAALTVVMALYYIFDLEYPRISANILGLIQHFVFKEPYRAKTSVAYKKFIKEIEKLL